MKIAYGTYGMPGMPLLPALPRLADIGYEGVELCVGQNYAAAPNKLSSPERQELRHCLTALGLELPAFVVPCNILADDPEQYRRELDHFRAAGELAQDLAPNNVVPVLVATLGGGSLTWEQHRDAIIDRVSEWADTADSCGTRFAVEPHVGGVLDTPEKSLQLLQAVASPALALNFDISHFAVAGYPLDDTVEKLVPHSIHTHVKDGRMVDGKVQFLLPGEGDFDYIAYFKAMHAAGWRGCITVEVSAMIFRQPDYDPWASAEFSYRTLSVARREAGVPED